MFLSMFLLLILRLEKMCIPYRYKPVHFENIRDYPVETETIQFQKRTSKSGRHIR